MTVAKKLRLPPGISATWQGKPYRHHWPYISQDGAEDGHVVRYEDSDGKKVFIPFFKRNGTRWQYGYAEGQRPLFGLDELIRIQILGGSDIGFEITFVSVKVSQFKKRFLEFEFFICLSLF